MNGMKKIMFNIRTLTSSLQLLFLVLVEPSDINFTTYCMGIRVTCDRYISSLNLDMCGDIDSLLLNLAACEERYQNFGLL